MTEEGQNRSQLFGRRRRANFPGGRLHRHEVRVSPEEEALLLRLAAAQQITIPRLLVESALAATRGETLTERRRAMVELFAIHRLLAAVSNNVNQLARAANATGHIGSELSATLNAVRQTAERIDRAIDGLQ